MQFLYQYTLSFITGIFLLMLNSPKVSAGFLQSHSGHGRLVNAAGSRSETSNFAALDRLKGFSTPGDVFGTGFLGFDDLAQLGDGSAAFDTSSRYLYLYQHVNNGPGTDSLTDLGVSQIEGTSITSFAQWNLVLADDQGPVSIDNSLGADGISFSPLAPANIGVIAPAVQTVAAGRSLRTGDVVLQGNGRRLTIFYSPSLSFGETGVLHGITSNFPPFFLETLEGVCTEANLCGFIPKPGLVAPGDFNHDGNVTAADYTLWRDGLGTTYTAADYDVWKMSFGNSAAGASTEHVGVPEPTSTTLSVLFLVCAAWYLRCRNSDF